MYTLLLIEDDHAIRDMLKMFLTGKQYEVLEAANGKQAKHLLSEATPDLIVLDWMLPDTDGLQILQHIRINPIHQNLPVLMLTAKAEETDKIKGLEVGADDYMTKPVSLQELNARIRALLRRAQGLNSQKLLVCGDISLNPDNKTVAISDETVKISSMEYRLLYFFMKHPERLYSRSQLLDNVWGQSTFVEERTVDVHIMRLRKILKAYCVDSMLQTIRGMGYRFAPLTKNNIKREE